jgi:molybdate transport system ATP-binding protein
MTTEPESLVEVELHRKKFRLALRLAWRSESLVLFGASGSGKTTLLRILLGLEPDARAKVCLAGRWLDDPDRGLRTPVHLRHLGWVPQSPTLFPDRNVARNIRFGTKRNKAGEWLSQVIEVLELRGLLDRSVAELSGGERQRVALARAIARRPQALLLDEPLASLDIGLRARILPYLLRVRDELGLPLVYITHDPDEAILLGDEIAVLDRGHLIAQGTPRETLWSQSVEPLANRFGVENVVEVSSTMSAANGPDSDRSTRVRTRNGLELETPWPLPPGESLSLGIRAEDILIALDPPGRISARNRCPGQVARIDVQSDHVLVHVDLGGDRLIAKVTAGAVGELSLTPGMPVTLIIKSQALRRIR